MTELHREVFEFDAFRLDTRERRLLRDGEPVPLEPKVFETLLKLIRHERRLVGKAELMQAVWPDSFVEESNLTRNISVLRKALSPHAGGPEYIETVAKFGYRFIGEVRALKGDSADAIAQLATVSPTDVRYQERDTAARWARGAVDEVQRHNLPGQLTSFVGRDREISEIERLLASTRLLTLTGAGGCGKTRLALQVAALLLLRFKDGAWFVDLAPLSEATLVTQTVATVLGVREGSTRSLRDSVVEHLRHRRVLLVLDNCEHVIGACAELAEALLRGAPHLRILATSRERIGITGETVWRVSSLSLPGTSRSLYPEALLEFEATRLFVERATTVEPALAVDLHDVVTIADICHRLDGLPLAIELAAARVNVLSLEQINTRLHDRFRLLTGGSRTSVARQSTLRGTLDWSYHLLSETERRVLRELSVFSGGWSLGAAEEVCSGGGVERGDLLDLLSHLVDKSLVIVEDQGRGRRYRLLESVRQYASDRLLEHGRANRVKTRHLRFFFDLARIGEPELMGPRQASWLKQLHLEHDNLRAALDWCMSPAVASEQGDRAVDFATALWWFWLKRGLLAEGRQWLERAVHVAPVSSPSRGAKASNALANMAYFQGDFAGMAAYAANSVALGREADDLFSVAFGLGLQTIAAAESGDVGLALRLAGDCRAAASASGNPWTAGPALYVLGFVAISKGDYDEASRIYEEAWNISIRDPWASSIHVSCLVGLRVVQGRLAEAAALGAEGLALCGGIEDPVRTAWTLEVIAAAHAVQDRPVQSARLWGASQQLLDSAASSLPPTHRWIRDLHFAGVKAALGDTAFQAAFAEGWAMSMGQASQYALEGL